MEKATFEMEIKKEISYAELWEAIWGSDGTGITYWCSKIRTAEGKSIKLWLKGEREFDLVPNPQDFRLYEDEEEKWHLVTLEDLARGYKMAYEQNLTHCGSCLVADLEDADACSGDVLIQLAVFGEVIYG
jgi:hypothetical protein